ncbi:MAG: DUF1189 domain-containing protein [Clostridiales bacterium]|nr:DUF1189 domain-containing protein [Clostridiales bacterium]
MEQDNRVGFFERYFIACFQPGKYKTLINDKMGKHVCYTIVLLLFMLLVDTVIPVGAWVASVGGLKNLFLNRLPEFTLDDGEFEMSMPLSFTIGGTIRIEIDSDVEEYTDSDYNTDYTEEILISRSNVLIRVSENVTEIKFSTLSDIFLDNEGLAGAIPLIIASLIFYFIISLVTKGAQYLILAVGFGLLCRSSFRTENGQVVSVKEAILIALYAKTLFGILSSVNICLGYLISSFWVTIISVMVIMGYIYRAEISILKPKAS